MYNGHKNYNHWNVSLYIFNEYPLYIEAVRLVKLFTKDRAAHYLLDYCIELYGDTTPDGVKWTYSSVRATIAGYDWY
jgi:hypothetical protein